MIPNNDWQGIFNSCQISGTDMFNGELNNTVLRVLVPHFLKVFFSVLFDKRIFKKHSFSLKNTFSYILRLSLQTA